jgi:hypothetical protein
MRAQARSDYETKYTAEVNYAQLIKIYESVLKRSVSKELAIPAGASKL